MIGPLSNPLIRETLAQMRGLQKRDRVTAYWPSETECTQPGCGHDSLTNSKKKIDCTVCDARGYITTWSTQILIARVVRPETLSYNIEGGTMVAETADLVLYMDLSNKETIDEMIAEERSYLTVDWITYRPTTSNPIGVTGSDELRIECATHSP